MGYAEPLYLSKLSDWIETALGVSTAASYFLAMIIILIFWLIPIFMLDSGKYILGNVAIMLMAVFTAIGWLPFYTWVLICLYYAITLSDKLKAWF